MREYIDKNVQRIYHILQQAVTMFLDRAQNLAERLMSLELKD